MAALLGGQIDMYFGNASEIIPNAESGSIRILGVAADTPLRQLPQIPLIKDNAVPAWNGFFASARTPKPIVAKLAKEIIAATRDPTTISAALVKLGIESNGNTPEEFAEEIKKRTEIVRFCDLRRKFDPPIIRIIRSANYAAFSE
jgi:tripartite-type tricarboxylate transporter receptor subunit TctC